MEKTYINLNITRNITVPWDSYSSLCNLSSSK